MAITPSYGVVRHGAVWFTTSPQQLKREAREKADRELQAKRPCVVIRRRAHR